MEIRKHIAFSKEKAPELYCFLKENSIPFKDGAIICAVDILDSDPYWEIVSSHVTQKNLSCLSNTIFTTAELENAEWIRVRSQWRYGYPQPENGFQYESVTYSNKDLCNVCGCGLEQVNPFRMKQQPKWGKRHFLMLNWVDDELFISQDAKMILQQHTFSGIDFAEVWNKTGKQQFSDICQLKISTVLDKGLIAGQSPIRNQHICEKCGSIKYTSTGIGMFTFRRQLFDTAPDFVNSYEIFGGGRSASRLILIRQNVYQILQKKNLEKDLVFEPINLED